ncbi:zinc-binding dehydrogenase [Methylovirgula sp. HY1]|uniref:zinc-binding dehydrogenase n=1 Tax=Methylovirgula sp. HY1 TaxID=2822761 RepID=UPI001C5B8C89|nr:zinc-binding dehydrogenase [Methylovirgula sp. HY1]QXX73837.1 Alcohol dehydrogenase [Methylovirgula sp. HY1]
MTKATMRAARFDRASLQLTVQDVPVPQPGPGEVLVRIEAAGICGSDVHMIKGEFSSPLEQVTPGHEAAGVIAQVGAAVPVWQAGQRVTLAAGKSSCMVMGQAYDGGWAEYVAVPHYLLIAVPDNVPIEQAAIIPDAVATPYGGIVHRGRIRLGEVVGLWGIGGLGQHAVQIARLSGARLIIAIDPVDAARQRALALGADHALDPRAVDVRAEVMHLTENKGLNLAVELSGSGSALDQTVACLGFRGRSVVVGMSTEPVRLTELSVMFGYNNHSLLGFDGGQEGDVETLMCLAASGRLDLSRSVSHILPLEEVARGVEMLSKKIDNPARIVVKP